MTVLRALRAEIVRAGYGEDGVVDDYAFSDVFSDAPGDRRVAVAAFTQSPPSYRTAAIGVVNGDGADAETLVGEYRALGAPLLFLISGDDVSIWQVRAHEPPRALLRTQLSELPSLFAEQRHAWSPLAIHRAKSIGAFERSYQLDFVDAGLMPLVEGRVHAKLDRLLESTLADAVALYRTRTRVAIDHRALFRATFRLLAAKVLQDRGHALSTRWNADDIDSVLDGISKYYRLPRLTDNNASAYRYVFSEAWRQLQKSISFRNISADDLAFVYENTLITPETRKHFGTHSTPRQVAEYAVSRLEFWRGTPDGVHVYEPFAGAGVFLVAALRHLRELLPTQWTDLERHEFLVKRISGDEVDAFACEVATLSLILADYPNANGWKVSDRDLFAGDALIKSAGSGRAVLCNPPFEAFTLAERSKYPAMAARSLIKAAAALSAILESKPSALAFVMPRAFLDEKAFRSQRERVEEQFGDIELVALPEGTFKHSTIESALLIAKTRRSTALETTHLRSSVVRRQDRDLFLQLGVVSESRASVRPYRRSGADLWIRQFEAIWKYLSKNPRLETLVDIHRGLEWLGPQSEAASKSRQAGFRKGLHSADSVRTLVLGDPVWLDTRLENLRRANDAPWTEPKVVVNAVRLSRGPWRVAAAVDTNGLVVSQQLFGCWAKPTAGVSLPALAAVLSGPLANAFVSAHSEAKGIRVSTMRALPLPVEIPDELSSLVAQYVSLLSAPVFELGDAVERTAASLLGRIDALILRSYDLPAKMERELLESFRGATRPTIHPWSHWFPEGFRPAVPLHEYLSRDYNRITAGWVLGVFKPLPEAEAALIRDYVE